MNPHVMEMSVSDDHSSYYKPDISPYSTGAGELAPGVMQVIQPGPVIQSVYPVYQPQPGYAPEGHSQVEALSPVNRIVTAAPASNKNDGSVALSLFTLLVGTLGLVYICVIELQMKSDVVAMGSDPSSLLLVTLLVAMMGVSMIGFNSNPKKKRISSYMWAILALMWLSITLALLFQYIWDLPLIHPMMIKLSKDEVPGMMGNSTVTSAVRHSGGADPKAKKEQFFHWWSVFEENLANEKPLQWIKDTLTGAWILPPMFRMSSILWTPFGQEGKVNLPPHFDQIVICAIFAVLAFAHSMATRGGTAVPILSQESKRVQISTWMKRALSKETLGPRVIRSIAALLFVLSCGMVMVDHTSTEVFKYDLHYCPGLVGNEHCEKRPGANYALSIHTMEEEITPFLLQSGLQITKLQYPEDLKTRRLGPDPDAVVIPAAVDGAAIPEEGEHEIKEEEEEEKQVKLYQPWVSFVSPWVISSLPRVWILIIGARLSLMAASSACLLKDLQGGLVSFILIAIAMGVNVLCGLLSWETAMVKAMGEITLESAATVILGSGEIVPKEATLPVPAHLLTTTVAPVVATTIAPIIEKLADARRLSDIKETMESLTVSNYSRFHARALVGAYHCMTSIAESLSGRFIPADLSHFCANPNTSAAWRAAGGTASRGFLLITTAAPLYLLLILLLANIYLCGRKKATPTDDCHPWTPPPYLPVGHQQERIADGSVVDAATYPLGNNHFPTYLPRTTDRVSPASIMGARQYSVINGHDLMAPANQARGAIHPHPFSSNGNLFARNSLPGSGPLLRGYTPALTPRSGGAYSQGLPAIPAVTNGSGVEGVEGQN